MAQRTKYCENNELAKYTSDLINNYEKIPKI